MQGVSFFSRRPRVFIICAFCVFDLLLVLVFVNMTPRVLTVAFLNVGQGDAIFIESPSGAQMLIDVGPPSGAVLRELGAFLPFWDRSIDVLLLSHPDLDHVGGMPDVFARYRVSAVVSGETEGKSTVALQKDDFIAREGAVSIVGRRGVTIDLGGGVSAELLAPDVSLVTNETNDASSVVRVRFGNTAFLFSGDLSVQGEESVVGQFDDKALSAQVLKLGHHGSRTSSGETWLQAVAPDIAVISAGKDNRYGHPHQDVLDRLRLLHIDAVATYEEGTIVFESDGARVWRKGQ
jgi:competence protein ComEC